MNYALVFNVIGMVLRIEIAFMGVPLIVSLIYGGEDLDSFVCSMAIMGAISLAFTAIRPRDEKMRARDSFLTAALSWIFISAMGALPFYFCGYFPSLVDCIFESVSGFTTTGATVLTNIEELPRGILFWRGFSHWIGGVGVLVFILAVMPSMSASSVNLLKAESTGPTKGKILPKVSASSKYMYFIYGTLTAGATGSLMLAGMPLYDALIHAFSVAGTGGFSTRQLSLAAYNSPAIEFICAVFMLLFAVNFTVYFYLIRKEIKAALLDEELRFFIIVVSIAVLTIFIDITPFYHSAATAFRHTFFQVSSIISTTCLSTANYDTWPTLSKLILMLIMILGGSAGSTAGGIKMVRVLLLIKGIRAELGKVLHPNVVKPIVVNKKAIDDKTMMKVYMYFFTYFAVMLGGVIMVSLDDFDLVTSVTAVISVMSNAGLGLGQAGPAGSYSVFSPLSKLVMSFCMLAGRLEMFPVLLMLAPSTWKKAL